MLPAIPYLKLQALVAGLQTMQACVYQQDSLQALLDFVFRRAKIPPLNTVKTKVC